jgi:hypothetical protein
MADAETVACQRCGAQYQAFVPGVGHAWLRTHACIVVADPVDLCAVPWRVGGSPATLGRTLYACPPGCSSRHGEVLIGMMDTAELAREVVDTHNARVAADSIDAVG